MTNLHDLGTKAVLAFVHNSLSAEERLSLRNELIGLYFKARVVAWTKEGLQYTETDDVHKAHDWFNKLIPKIQQEVARDMSGEFETEARICSRLIGIRPETATV